MALIAEATAAAVLLQPKRAPPAAEAVQSPTTLSAAPTSLTISDGHTVHLLGLGGATTSGLLSRVAREITGAVDAVVAFWGADWQHDIVIVAAGSDDQFYQLTREPAGTQWIGIAAPPTASIRSTASRPDSESSSPPARSR
jgi:hypothetical protein